MCCSLHAPNNRQGPTQGREATLLWLCRLTPSRKQPTLQTLQTRMTSWFQRTSLRCDGRTFSLHLGRPCCMQQCGAQLFPAVQVPMSPGPTASVPERMDGRWSAPAEPSQRPVTIKSAVRKPAAAEPATAKRKAQTLHQPELQGRKPKREAHKRSSSHIAAVHQAGPAAPHVQQQKSVALGRHTTAKAGTQPPAHRLAGSQSSRPAPQAAKPTAKPVLSASKPLSIVPEKAPARTRAEGGRKRRKKV